MAQTWLVNEQKLRMARRADAAVRPLLPMLRLAFPPRRPSMRAPERILVSELWHIGDVVLAMPFLAALRTLFPDARITLLGRAHARETLKHTGLVDDFVSFDFPWTFLDEDRRPTIRELLKLPGVIRRLRLQKFDLAFDCSRDGRNNLVLFLSGSARRIGFAFGGGEFLLTDAVPVGSLNEHRTADWLRLLEPFEVEQRRGDFADARENGFDARLAVSDTERRWAQDFLREHGHSRGDVLIAVHPGGSSRLKRWPLSHFESLARTAATSDRARILWIVDPAGTGADANLPVGSIVARPSLRELIALLSESALLVSNDGGPMHLAGALGIPTFAVYSWGNPEWWRPYSSARHSFVRREDISCRPCAGHCIFPEPICLTGLSYQTVADEFAAELARLRKDEGLSLQVHSFQQSSR